MRKYSVFLLLLLLVSEVVESKVTSHTNILIENEESKDTVMFEMTPFTQAHTYTHTHICAHPIYIIV